MELGETEDEKAKQSETRQGKARQGKARQGKARQGKKSRTDDMMIDLVTSQEMKRTEGENKKTERVPRRWDQR